MFREKVQLRNHRGICYKIEHAVFLHSLFSIKMSELTDIVDQRDRMAYDYGEVLLNRITKRLRHCSKVQQKEMRWVQ
jgi:hypothetical protein